MVRNLADTDLSELEREFELEMDDEFELGEDSETDEEYEEDSELEFEDESEFAAESGDYAERFFELSEREFESESEADEEVNGLLNEMERDFFWGGLKKRLKRAGKGLLKKGLKFAAGQFPALQAFKGLTQLARGDLKGMLGALAKAGIMSAIPGAGAALPALKAIGFNPLGDSETNRDAWNNYVEVSREAFENLADTLHENADNPVEASKLAANAFQAAVKKIQTMGPAAMPGRGASGVRRKRGRRVIYLAPGQSVVIKRR